MSAFPAPRLPDGVGPLGLSVLLHVGVFALALGVARRTPATWLEHDAGVAVGSTFEVATDDSTLSSTSSDATNGDVPSPPADAAPAELPEDAPPTEPAPASSATPTATPPSPPPEDANDATEPATRPSTPRTTPRTPSTTAPSPTSNDAAPNSPPSEPAASGPSGSDGSAGTTGVAARAGNLVDAVTRVLPLAALSVKTWSEFPLGAAGESHARLTLDDEGKLVELTTDEKTPEHLNHTLRSLRLLLRSGRFQSGKTDALVSRVVVQVFVERALGNGTLDGDGIDKMSAEYAERERPGRAIVTYRSGLQLRFEVKPDDSRR